MRSKLLLGTVILLVFGGSYLAKGLLCQSTRHDPQRPRRPQRIVSMAPCVTETLFALGLGDRVVGVTRYCSYPPEVKQKKQIGGFLDPNFEAIVRLKPDLVVMLVESEQSMPAFSKLGLSTLVVCHQSIEGILESMGRVGRACGKQQQADRLVADVQARLDRVQQKIAGLPRPRVLFAIDRTPGSGALEDVYVAGPNCFCGEIITLAGGQNACGQYALPSPVVSAEGILRMNPQVILDMVSGLVEGKQDAATILRDWQQLPQVEAVANGQVHVVEADYAFVPGPRFILLVEDLARRIHPGVDWNDRATR